MQAPTRARLSRVFRDSQEKSNRGCMLGPYSSTKASVPPGSLWLLFFPAPVFPSYPALPSPLFFSLRAVTLNLANTVKPPGEFWVASPGRVANRFGLWPGYQEFSIPCEDFRADSKARNHTCQPQPAEAGDHLDMPRLKRCLPTGVNRVPERSPGNTDISPAHQPHAGRTPGYHPRQQGISISDGLNASVTGLARDSGKTCFAPLGPGDVHGWATGRRAATTAALYTEQPHTRSGCTNTVSPVRSVP